MALGFVYWLWLPGDREIIDSESSGLVADIPSCLCCTLTSVPDSWRVVLLGWQQSSAIQVFPLFG